MGFQIEWNEKQHPSGRWAVNAISSPLCGHFIVEMFLGLMGAPGSSGGVFVAAPTNATIERKSPNGAAQKRGDRC